MHSNLSLSGSGSSPEILRSSGEGEKAPYISPEARRGGRFTPLDPSKLSKTAEETTRAARRSIELPPNAYESEGKSELGGRVSLDVPEKGTLEQLQFEEPAKEVYISPKETKKAANTALELEAPVKETPAKKGGMLGKISNLFGKMKAIGSDQKEAKTEPTVSNDAVNSAKNFIDQKKVPLEKGNNPYFQQFLADRGLEKIKKMDPDAVYNEFQKHLAELISDGKITNLSPAGIDGALKELNKINQRQRTGESSLKQDLEMLKNFEKVDTNQESSRLLGEANSKPALTTKLHQGADFLGASTDYIHQHGEDTGTSKAGGLQVGYSSSTNFKASMDHPDEFINEDRQIATTIMMGSAKIPFLGVFDGHGGEKASDHLKNNLPKFVETELKTLEKPMTDDKISQALAKAFIKCNDELLKSLIKSGDNLTEGSTATISLIIDGNLWAASVGDTRAAIVTETGNVINLTQDADPAIPSYKKQIEDRGGFVQDGKINRGLGVATSFGDFGEKGMSVFPNVTKMSLKDLGEHPTLIVGCDGLFDSGNTSEVGKVVASLKDAKPEEIAQTLARKARNAVITDFTALAQVYKDKAENIRGSQDIAAYLNQMLLKASKKEEIDLIANAAKTRIETIYQGNDLEKAQAFKQIDDVVNQFKGKFVEKAKLINEDDITVLCTRL